MDYIPRKEYVLEDERIGEKRYEVKYRGSLAHPVFRLHKFKFEELKFKREVLESVNQFGTPCHGPGDR